MREINPNLLAYLQQEILPQYEAVDGAHGPEHIRRIISNSLELAQQLDVDINMVYTIAACHDLGIQKILKSWTRIPTAWTAPSA